MIYEDELNPKIVSMMKNMNFIPEMGLEKNQRGPPRFVERKVPVLKHGVGYYMADGPEEEDETENGAETKAKAEVEAEPAKGKDKMA